MTGHGASGMREDYAALDLLPGATLEEVRSAYRRLARALHPDLNPGAAGTLMARINQAYGNLSRRLAADQPGSRPVPAGGSRPAWSPYRFEDFGFEPAGPRPGQTAGPERPAPAGFASRPAPAGGPGLGPLGGGPRQEAWSGPEPRAQAGPAPLADDRTDGWRLMGIRLEGQDVIYQVEVSGRARSLTLPVRRPRPCRQCAGAGSHLTRQGLAPCPACGGKGSLVRSDQVRVDLPSRWLPGRRVAVQAGPGQGSILVELRRGRPEGRN